eukprot:scaffold9605_cov54-Phaeocystis_antarctica.AAC.3
MHSRWIFTVWTLDTFISDNEVGWALADPGSRIFPPFSVHARGELGADSGSRIFPCRYPCPSGRLRTPDLGSWIVRLAPHTVSAKPDPGFWISTSRSRTVPVRPGPGYSGFPTLDPRTRDLEPVRTAPHSGRRIQDLGAPVSSRYPLRDRRRLPEIVRARPQAKFPASPIPDCGFRIYDFPDFRTKIGSRIADSGSTIFE